RDTSGVLLLARHAQAAAELAAAFRRKDCRKVYWAIVVGVPKPERGRIELALAKLPGRAGERMEPDEAGKPGRPRYTVHGRTRRGGRRRGWSWRRSPAARINCGPIAPPSGRRSSAMRNTEAPGRSWDCRG